MPRPPRKEIAGGVFHIFARGNRRQTIFRDDSDRRQFLLMLGLVAGEMKWRVLVGCLMDNHVHFVIETPLPNRSKGMQALLGGYARYFNDAYQKVGHLFHRPYGFSVLETPADVMYVTCYVLLNPVRQGMCKTAADYQWSTYKATLDQTARPKWLDADRLLSHFANNGADPADTFALLVKAVEILGPAGMDEDLIKL